MAGRRLSPLLIFVFCTALMHIMLVDGLTNSSMNTPQGIVQQDAFGNSDLSQIKSDLKATMTQVHTLTQENQLLKSKITTLENKLSDSQLNASMLHLMQQNGEKSPVAFLVQFKDDWGTSKETREDMVLKYDDLVTNIGGGYNINTGIFTCPRAGLYLLSIRCHGFQSIRDYSRMYMTLYRNNRNLVYCTAGGPSTRRDDRDFVQIPIFLDKGDHISTHFTYQGQLKIQGGTLTFFSGVLLSQKHTNA